MLKGSLIAVITSQWGKFRPLFQHFFKNSNYDVPFGQWHRTNKRFLLEASVERGENFIKKQQSDLEETKSTKSSKCVRRPKGAFPRVMPWATFLVDFLLGTQPDTLRVNLESSVILCWRKKKMVQKIRWLKRSRGFLPGRKTLPNVMEVCFSSSPNSSARSCERNFPYLSLHHCWVWDSWEFSPRFGGDEVRHEKCSPQGLVNFCFFFPWCWVHENRREKGWWLEKASPTICWNGFSRWGDEVKTKSRAKPNGCALRLGEVNCMNSHRFFWSRTRLLRSYCIFLRDLFWGSGGLSRFEISPNLLASLMCRIHPFEACHFLPRFCRRWKTRWTVGSGIPTEVHFEKFGLGFLLS